MKYDELIEMHAVMKEQGRNEILPGLLRHLIAKKTGNADPLSYNRIIRAMIDFELIKPSQYGAKRKVLLYDII